MSTTGELTRHPDAADAIDRPFAPEILARATAIAAQHRVVTWFEDRECYGFGVDLPGAGGDGPTPDACMASAREASAREAFVAAVACTLERGEEPPQPLTLLEQADNAA